MQIDKVLFRYIMVGIVNTTFGYGVFALLIFINLHYTVALFIATIIGVFFNFHTFGRLVFKQPSWHLIWKFFVVYGFLYLVNICCIFILMTYTHNAYTANAITLIFIAGLGFLLNRNFVYKKNYPSTCK